MCESYNDDWAQILARHEKFHDAMQTVRAEQLWSAPGDWKEAVIAARYMQKPDRKVENVTWEEGGE